ncbi:ribosome hibernation-promoting factor, HPF/YfiA family [Helcococcus ovis]|uniref:ribosome hibernation-promoting factor, HPF/YfiA family n=1 Tax=Helcococcus ovis TaxID=72026 RepID=UPI0038BA1F93
MKVQYVGKNITVRENFKEEVDKKLGRIDKFFDGDIEAKASFSNHGNFKTAEITIWLKKGTILRAEETSDDMLSSVDRVIESLERQIRKYKTKLQVRNSGESIRYDEIPVDDSTISEDDEPKVVKIKKIGLKPMFIEDAVMQMNLLGHDFFVYQDAETEKVSVVYKRNDGNYGLIEQN